MRETILKLLKEHRDQPISGEEISSILNVSRTAVWKHIKALQDLGYSIESIPRKGYVLQGTPDRMLQHEIKPLLATKTIGQKLEYFASISSTNQKIKEMARAGAPEGLVVVADEQTEGRGRLGRQWHSANRAGLWFSILLRPSINAMEASKLTLVAGLAVAQALWEGLHIKVGIKWPNDLVWQGKKVAGILTELSGELEAVNYLVLGIGINANQVDFPPELEQRACSLWEITGTSINRPELLALVLNKLEYNYQRFLEGNFVELLSEWKELCLHLGQWVTLVSPQGERKLQVIDVDQSGALKGVDEAGNEVLVHSGEISVRALTGQYI